MVSEERKDILLHRAKHDWRTYEELLAEEQRQSLKRDMRILGLRRRKFKEFRPRPRACKRCDKIFTATSKRHFICPPCAEKARNRSYIKRYGKRQKASEKASIQAREGLNRHRCPECNEGFISKHNYNEHIKHCWTLKIKVKWKREDKV